MIWIISYILHMIWTTCVANGRCCSHYTAQLFVALRTFFLFLSLFWFDNLCGSHLQSQFSQSVSFFFTLKRTTAQVVETSVTVNNNSPIQDYLHPDDQTQPTFEMTPGFKPFTVLISFESVGYRQWRHTIWSVSHKCTLIVWNVIGHSTSEFQTASLSK